MGNDPNARKRAKKAVLTFGELFLEYMELDSKKSKKSWEYDQQQYDRYLASWASRKLDDIDRSDIQALHAKMGQLTTKKATKGGKVTANRLLALVRRVFNFAIEQRYLTENPAKGIKEYPYKPRKRRLDDDQLSRLLKAIADDQDDTIRDLASLIFLTMARPGEVIKMEWRQLDLKKQVWNIPDTKNGTSDRKVLSRQAIEILRGRQAQASNDYVFPGKGNKGHLVEPKRGWARILARAGIDDFHLHDLRSMMSSLVQDHGANVFSLMALLNHKSIQATNVYVTPGAGPVRAILESATDAAFGRVLSGAGDGIAGNVGD